MQVLFKKFGNIRFSLLDVFPPQQTQFIPAKFLLRWELPIPYN
jgi:hypothetical protein